MINREIIRIKIVQLTYAYYQNGNKNIETAEKELFFSLSKAYDLYNYMLALIVAVNKEAARRNEVLVQRAKREGTAEPSQKFVFNRFAIQLAENIQLNEFMSTQKSGWDENATFVSSLLEKIEQSDIYQDYMNSTDDNYDADRELWRKLYRTFIQDNDEIDSISSASTSRTALSRSCCRSGTAKRRRTLHARYSVLPSLTPTSTSAP